MEICIFFTDFMKNVDFLNFYLYIKCNDVCWSLKMPKINLLRIKFENVLSFKDEQEIFFTAESKYTNTPTSYIRRDSAIGNDLITPVTAFYGANASGKSNVVKVFTDIVLPLLGKTNSKPSFEFYKPFLLDDESASKPSSIEIDFCLNDIRCILFFRFDKTGILTENLTEYQNKNKRVIYDRIGSNIYKPDKEIISKFDVKYVEDSLSKRSDLLVLDILDTRGIPHIHDIFEALKDICKVTFINIIETMFNMDSLAEKIYQDKSLHKKVVELIKYADLGITDIKVEEENDSSSLPFASSPTGKHYKINFEHIGIKNKKYELPVASESWGTGQFAKYLVMFIPILFDGGIYIIDELEEKLHPMMLAKIVEMFNNPNINIGGAQLIFTTHNTSILKSDILKRDEIWFVEKNEEGCSEVYPLTEFKAIREGFNYEKGYLEGRFGAIPYLGDINELANILEIKE